VQIHPGEVLDLIYDQKLKVVLLDVRSEADFNVFHIQDALNIPLADLDNHIEALREEPANTVFFTISNDETAATEAWKILVASSVPNVYILEGGINNWIATFAEEDFKADHPPIEAGDDQLKYTFMAAYGARYPAASPHADHFDLEYESKVVLQLKRGPSSGGCG
jgi:rhodanese-related sulfurtransferase